MADFCKQCSIKLFGEDFGDLSDLLEDDDNWADVLCEGCGRTRVDRAGKCIGQCLKNHGEKHAQG